MLQKIKNFELPSIILNYDKQIRKAGFELEFSNINIDTIIHILTDNCAFKMKKLNSYLFKFDSQYGEFTLELDFELLSKQKLKNNIQEFFHSIGITIEQKKIEQVETLIAELSQDIVPYEISTPPIPIENLEIVNNLVDQLSKNNAKGTKEKIYYAFGLHINLEVISLETTILLDYLKAYVILQDFLEKDAKVDVTRKITPFIDKFKKDYILHILQEEYLPSQEEFIKDYINFNPTRNRSLDMLPILTFIDEKLVRSFLPKEKINPRPAFHYRLSNSLIGEDNWKISDEWNRWILVEKLANDPISLKTFSKEYVHYLEKFINFTSWESKITKWIQNHK